MTRLFVLLALACTPAQPSEAPSAQPAVEITGPVPSDEPEDDAGAPAAARVAVVPSDGTWPLQCPGHCDGRIAPGAADSILRQVGGGAKACFQRVLKSNPATKGRVVVEVLVLESGDVCGARVVESEIDDPTLIGCVLAVFQRIRVKPEHGCVVLRQPLTFRPAEG